MIWLNQQVQVSTTECWSYAPQNAGTDKGEILMNEVGSVECSTLVYLTEALTNLSYCYI